MDLSRIFAAHTGADVADLLVGDFGLRAAIIFEESFATALAELFSFIPIMKLRRRFMKEAVGNPIMQKALSVAIRIKACLNRDSTIHNWSINKVHSQTGISAKTINTYLPVLVDMGIISFYGKYNQHLLVHGLSSHSASRNICIDKFDFSSFRSVYNSLRAFLALSIQHRKDFIRRTIQTAANPKRLQGFKSARRTLKRLVRQGIVKCIGDKYQENGISYKRIAKETGNCEKTAEKIVKFAVLKGWMKKIRHYKWFGMPNVCHNEVYGFTFTTRNYGYVISSNSYKLSPRIAKSLGTFRW